MRVQLAQQAKDILGQSDLVIITERVDDVAFLIGQMVKMGLPEVLDRHIPRHWTQRGLSWGWTAVIWLAYIVTEGDHRKVSMATYLKGMHHTLSHLTAQIIAVLLRGGMLPQASVYPAAMRATRDLLRRRVPLTRKRAELLAHIQNTNSQYNLPEIGKKHRVQGQPGWGGGAVL